MNSDPYTDLLPTELQANIRLLVTDALVRDLLDIGWGV